MPIGTQTVTDAFTRANEFPITGNWTHGTFSAVDMDLTSNHVEPAGFGGDDADCFYNAWTGGNDQYSQAEITVNGTGAGAGMGVTVRRSTTPSTGTAYRLVLNSAGGFELAKFIAGAFTSLRTGTVTYVAATKLGLRIQGTTLQIWYGGVQIGTNVTDSGISTGNPGLAFSSATTSASADNWDAGTTGVAAAVNSNFLAFFK